MLSRESLGHQFKSAPQRLGTHHPMLGIGEKADLLSKIWRYLR